MHIASATTSISKKANIKKDINLHKEQQPLSGFLRGQLPLIILAAIVSFAIVNHGHSIMRFIDSFKNATATAPPLVKSKTDESILETLQLLHDEIVNVRRENANLHYRMENLILASSFSMPDSDPPPSLAVIDEQEIFPELSDDEPDMLPQLTDDEFAEFRDETAPAEYSPEFKGPFFMHDFQNELDMVPIDGMEIDADILSLFEGYEISNDPVYMENAEEYQAREQNFKNMLVSSLYDDRFYVFWNDVTKDFALYANVPMEAGTFLGTFAGVITTKPEDISLSWKYKGSVSHVDENGDPVDILIDGRKKGNWFHFLHIAEEGNVQPFFLPLDNMWHVAFRLFKDVQAGEELILSFTDLTA